MQRYCHLAAFALCGQVHDTAQDIHTIAAISVRKSITENESVMH